MGAFREGVTGYTTKYYHEIEDFLIKSGYNLDKGPLGEKGYVKVYSVGEGAYYVWVTFDLIKEKMYIYKEYGCGGHISSDTLDLEYKMNNLEDFINEVDEELDYWLSD